MRIVAEVVAIVVVFFWGFHLGVYSAIAWCEAAEHKRKHTVSR